MKGQEVITHTQISPEGVSFIRLLDGLQDSPVYPEGDGAGEQSESGVGENADDAVAGEGEEDEEA